MQNRMIALGPAAKKALHVLGALLIAYLFVIVLMTATSQAGVAGRLSRLANPIDYSTGYANWRAKQRDNGDDPQARVEELEASLEAARQAERNAQDNYLTTIGPLQALHPRLRAAPTCEFDPNATAPEEIAGTLSRIRACVADENFPPALRGEAERQASSDAPLQAGREWRATRRQVEALERRFNAANGALPALLRDRAMIEAAFSDLAVLQRSWAPGGSILAELPPAMVQIVLAFVSGMFGALLITLVLIVYPQNSLRLTSTGGGYGSRVLLGGLISLCIFVVLGGGTAVLGTTSSFASGEHNFLAFCAFGILAGMFSDRVAYWLSERADAFFKKQKASEEAVGGSTRAQPRQADEAARVKRRRAS